MTLSRTARIFSAALLVAMLLNGPASAADLPLATKSPLVGFTFDDRPLSLPVQQNFQMALLTAGSELGRTCGKTEAYGWRMKQNEQGRVDQIFNNTVDRLRGLGYVVEAQSPSSVSHDVTLFSADTDRKHFLFMWSAGEIGLVMVLCESSSPAGQHSSVVSPAAGDVLSSELSTPVPTRASTEAMARFTPVGDWSGSYTCEQGYTGTTLHIANLSGRNFSGFFKFYPTPKNKNIEAGSYNISGEYDKATHRVLINPGKWIKRPKGYVNTIIVGSFDPVAHSFSGLFQGITGCTSIEAKAGTPQQIKAATKTTKSKTVASKPKTKSKNKAAKKEPLSAAVPSAPKSKAPPSAAGITPDNPHQVAAPPPPPLHPTPAPATAPTVALPPVPTSPAAPPPDLQPIPPPPETHQPAPPLPEQIPAPPAPELQPAPPPVAP